MFNKLVRSSYCAFVLLVACGYLPTVAWVDGPQCETDPASCIDNPCDDDPDECVDPDPEPDPGCDGAQSPVNPQTALALGRLKRAAARSQRMEVRRLNGQFDVAVARNALSAEQAWNLKREIGKLDISKRTSKVDGQKNATSCPRPNRGSCYLGAAATFTSMDAACAAKAVLRITLFNLTGFPSLESTLEELNNCISNAEAVLAIQNAFCSTLPDE